MPNINATFSDLEECLLFCLSVVLKAFFTQRAVSLSFSAFMLFFIYL